MDKVEVKNLMELTETQLESITQKESIDGLDFVEKSILIHANGFYIDKVVFKKHESFFRFLVIRYLDRTTYTTPYEVFQEKKKVTRTIYTNWVDVERDVATALTNTTIRHVRRGD